MKDSPHQTHEAPTPNARGPWWHWPLLRLIGMVVALLLIGEQFPFSYFPMYSSFDPTTDYYYVADEAGEPYACVPIFGTSTANVKKMYRARLRAMVARRNAVENEATPAERQLAGEATLVYLRGLGANAGAAVPAEAVVLIRVILERSETGEITKRELPVATG
jgi:hypothetical protein